MSPQQPHHADTPKGTGATFFPALAAFAALVAGAAVFYYIGLEVGRAELKVRQDLFSMNLPSLSQEARDATNQLNEAASAFSAMLVNNATYAEMQSKVESMARGLALLESNNEALRVAGAQAEADLQTANAQIEKLTDIGQVYDVRTGNATTLLGGLVTIGVVRVDPDNTAILNLNGEAAEAKPGTILTTSGDKHCIVRVQRIDFVGGLATFTVDCSSVVVGEQSV